MAAPKTKLNDPPPEIHVDAKGNLVGLRRTEKAGRDQDEAEEAEHQPNGFSQVKSHGSEGVETLIK